MFAIGSSASDNKGDRWPRYFAIDFVFPVAQSALFTNALSRVSKLLEMTRTNDYRDFLFIVPYGLDSDSTELQITHDGWMRSKGSDGLGYQSSYRECTQSHIIQSILSDYDGALKTLTSRLEQDARNRLW